MCSICNKDTTESLTTLTKVGVETLNSAILKRKDNIASVEVGQTVHESCRKAYCRKETIERIQRTSGLGQSEHVEPRRTRSEVTGFHFPTCCVYCGSIVDKSKSHKKGYEFYRVATLEFDNSVRETCKKRINDEWAAQVLRRISGVSDLHAKDAIYHKKCDQHFRTGISVPALFITTATVEPNVTQQGPSKASAGNLRNDAFLLAMRFLEENDEENLTVGDLLEVMKDHGVEPYTAPYMKKKIQEHFGDEVVIFKVNQKEDVLALRPSVKSILRDFHLKSTSIDEDQSEEEKTTSILKAAAALLKNAILAIEANKGDEYSFHQSISSLDEALRYLPACLRSFLLQIFVGKKKMLKVASIGHAIIQASRPRAIIAPLQVALAVQLHHVLPSRFLIDQLYVLGFCSSYDEVGLFTKNAAVNGFQCSLQNLVSEQELFYQFVADNADHNVCTLDGKGTFHGMGIIASYTPGVFDRRRTIPRKRGISAEDIKNAGRIRIISPNSQSDECWNQLTYLVSKSTSECKQIQDPGARLDVLWLSMMYMKPMDRPAAWNGYMQSVHKGSHPGKAGVIYLPFINLPASDETCINSTLHFVAEQARKCEVIPVLTFDQPLYWKARKLIKNAPSGSIISSIVLRIGGFHTLMSFLGAIGHLMEGSGLQEVMCHIYAEDTVPHLLSGKAYARASRAHLLISSALYAILLKQTLGSCEEMIGLDSKERDDICNLFDETNYASVIVNRLDASTSFKKMEHLITEKVSSMVENRTSVLWIQYMEMIQIFRTFIRAERTGNWDLHLEAVRHMLPYLASSGHNNYTKSLVLYLSDMAAIEETSPKVWESFQNGMHPIRRSDRFWAGLSTDLVIEQDLMRTMKSTGGFTQRAGVGDTQMQTWVLSRPDCAFVNSLMQELTETKYESSEQHKELGMSRKQRDQKDLDQVITFLEEGSPFSVEEGPLRNIANGLVSHSESNVDRAKEIGIGIIRSMNNMVVKDFSFKKTNQAVLMTAKCATIGSSKKVDNSLLFQRFVLLIQRSNVEQSEMFKYELCSVPSSIFDENGLMKIADKPELAKAIAKLCKMDPSSTIIPSSEVGFVLDGGALLHRIPWNKGETYSSIYSRYVAYIKAHYGAATVVFDGYDSSLSTKDMAHQRRSRAPGREVHFNAAMKLTTRKDEFLSSQSNKGRFLQALGAVLEENGIKVLHAPEDADVLITETAVEMRRTVTTVVVGEDTDLLILFIHHLPHQGTKDIYFHSAKKKTVAGKSWHIKDVQEKLGLSVCKRLLLCHALLGCDTTSHLHGIGKGAALAKLHSGDEAFKAASDVFYKPSSNSKEVATAGESLLSILYGGSESEKLDALRFRIFEKKVTTAKSFVRPHDLPPTSAAAIHHSLRVYLQVQTWIGPTSKNNRLRPEEWGWLQRDGRLSPVTTLLAAAPDCLLKVFRCNCHGNCSTLRCTCRKNGLQCTSACGECKGLHCANSHMVPTEVDSDID